MLRPMRRLAIMPDPSATGIHFDPRRGYPVAMSATDPVTPGPRRSSNRRPLWIGLAALGLAVAAVGFYLRPHLVRRQAVIPETERLDEPSKNEELWRAAKQGQAERVEALLAEGVDVDAETEYGVTALQFAAGRGHLDVVRMLLAHEADVNKRDRFYGVPPLGWAASKQHWKVIAALLEGGANGADEILPGAAAAGQVDVVRVALDTGTIGKAALDNALAAVPQDQTEIVELLETAGATRPDSEPAETREQNDSTTTFERSQVPQAVSGFVAGDDDESGETVPQNWPSFRGTGATGVADGQKPPTTWDVEKGSNLCWKTSLAGLAHACPIVWGDRVYITTAVSVDGKSELKVGLYGDVDSADDQTGHSWRTYCLDKNSGDVVWERIAHEGVPRTKRHTKGSHANCTPATDGAHVVANFGSEGLYCYDRDGGLLWHHDLGTLDSGWFFDEDYQWGFASSPVIYRNLVIIQCDVGRGSYVAAFRIADGSQAWRTPRDEIPSWGSPTVVEGPERAELVTNATRFARGYDPLTGKELWRLARHSEITVPTPFYAEGMIFVASGYRPLQPVYAIRPGASGDISLREDETSNEFVSWSRPNAGPYLPTPIAYRGHLSICSNNGIVACYEAPTGHEIYKQRLPGQGAYTASPVAADGKLYFTSEEGQVTVLKAGARLEVLAQNALGEVCLSTPAISDAMMFFRTEGHVVAVGRPKARTK